MTNQIFTNEQLQQTFPQLRYFSFAHLKHQELKDASEQFTNLAYRVARVAMRTPHISNITQADQAIHKLLEAKDCAIRSMLNM